MKLDTHAVPKFTDKYSFVHFINGIIFYFILIKLFKFTFSIGLLIWFILHSIYELKDIYYTYFKSYTIRPTRNNKLYGIFHSNNSWYNSIGDTLSALLGFYVGSIF